MRLPRRYAPRNDRAGRAERNDRGKICMRLPRRYAPRNDRAGRAERNDRAGRAEANDRVREWLAMTG